MGKNRFEHLERSLLPAKTGGGFRMDDHWIWGGSPILGDDGKVHLYASMWSKEFAFHPNWISHSRIVHAVADSPEGPFGYSDDALPHRGSVYWDGVATHNPSIHRYGDIYVLFYMGTTLREQALPDGSNPRLTQERYAQARCNQRIGVATADSPYGPWVRREAPILDVRPGCWDALMTTNPAPWVFADGSVLLL